MSSKETKRNIKIAFLFLALSLSLCLFLILINSIIFHPPLMNCHAFSLVRALKRTKPQMKLICCLHLFRSFLLLLSGCVFLANLCSCRRREEGGGLLIRWAPSPLLSSLGAVPSWWWWWCESRFLSIWRRVWHSLWHCFPPLIDAAFTSFITSIRWHLSNSVSVCSKKEGRRVLTTLILRGWWHCWRNLRLCFFREAAQDVCALLLALHFFFSFQLIT